MSASPSFAGGSDPGSVIGWYIGTGGNGPPSPPNLIFDAFDASADDWLDWDHTNLHIAQQQLNEGSRTKEEVGAH